MWAVPLLSYQTYLFFVQPSPSSLLIALCFCIVLLFCCLNQGGIEQLLKWTVEHCLAECFLPRLCVARSSLLFQVRRWSVELKGAWHWLPQCFHPASDLQGKLNTEKKGGSGSENRSWRVHLYLIADSLKFLLRGWQVWIEEACRSLSVSGVGTRG